MKLLSEDELKKKIYNADTSLVQLMKMNLSSI